MLFCFIHSFRFQNFFRKIKIPFHFQDQEAEIARSAVKIYPDDHVGITPYGCFTKCHVLELTQPGKCVGLRALLKPLSAPSSFEQQRQEEESVIGRVYIGEFKISTEGNWQKINDGNGITINMKAFGELSEACKKIQRVLPKIKDEEIKRQQIVNHEKCN